MRTSIALAVLLAGLVATTANASPLIYRPLSPTFGGNPNLAAWMFEVAGAQNLWTGGSGGGGGGGGTDFGGGIGGPVIIINPGDTTVDGPDVGTNKKTDPTAQP